MHGYSTLRMNDWPEFRNYIPKFSENWAFRGQENSDWVLNTAIERTAFIKYYRGIESGFVSEFQRGARNYLGKDETPGHLIEWLALMQHYGAPTRLLDLTRSPFIAAYFAFEFCKKQKNDHVAVWCMNLNVLRSKSLEILSEEFGEDLKRSNNLIEEALYERIFYSNEKELVFPIEPFRMNRRYSLQQSVFVSTGTSQATLMDQLGFLGEEMEKTVVKIEIPTECKEEVLRDLQKMNLHRASLFPGLDGYALSLKLRYDNMKSPEQLLSESIKKLDDADFPFTP